jgi:hypothetical protein
MGYRTALALLVAAGIAAAADRERDTVIQRAAEKVRAQFRSLTAYTCLETVEREYFAPFGNTLERDCGVLMEQRKHPTPDLVLMRSMRDRLRLEVAISGRGEIQSWPGASKFNDAGIDALVSSGPIGTGAFGTLLNLIFTTDAKKYVFTGEMKEAGRRCLLYNFSVPVADSHYRVKTQDNRDWLAVGYDGVLCIDAETADPVRVSVVVSKAPLAANTCETQTSLSFTRDAGIGEGLLIPVTAAQHFVTPNGSEVKNKIGFSNCHQYASESSISYYTPASEMEPARRVAAKLPPEVPDWLPFSMELVTPVDSDSAAVGDRFTARLASPIVDGRRMIAPKGARIEGRVSRVDVGYWPKELVAIGLTPESIEIKGAAVPFAARLDLRTPIVAKQQKQRKGLEFYLPDPGQLPHDFRLPGSHNVLAKGFTSMWLTAKRK